MRTRVAAFLAAVMLAAPSVAGAQPWKDAYERGDVFRALDMLQPLVFEADTTAHVERELDPLAPLYLATYYVNGWRVRKDLVTACGLTMLARRAADMQARDPEPAKQAIEALDQRTCAVLSDQQRVDAMMVGGGCPNIGLAGQIVELEDGGWVEVLQRTFVVDRAGRRTEAEIALPCAQQVLPVRYRKLVPSSGSAGHPRELVQLFAWYSGMVKGERRRGLLWIVWEVVDGVMEPSAAEWVADEPGSAWPVHPVPDLVQFDFRFRRDGEVEYFVTNAAGERKRGELRRYADLVKAAGKAPR